MVFSFFVPQQYKRLATRKSCIRGSRKRQSKRYFTSYKQRAVSVLDHPHVHPAPVMGVVKYSRLYLGLQNSISLDTRRAIFRTCEQR